MDGGPARRDLESEYYRPPVVCWIASVTNSDGTYLFVPGKRDDALLCVESGTSVWTTDKIAESVRPQLCFGAGVLPVVAGLWTCVCASVFPPSRPGAAHCVERLSKLRTLPAYGCRTT